MTRIRSTFRFPRMVAVAALATGLLGASIAPAGSIIVTGHDPDFHAQGSGNTPGAINLFHDFISYARDGNAAPFLFLETSPVPNDNLGGHRDSQVGLTDAGYVSGVDYVRVDAATFATVNLAAYSAILIPSTFGGSLTGDDLKAVDARSTDILNYINAGGGLVALAEDTFHARATVGGEPAHFGFLPFLVSSAPLDQNEVGNTLTPFGASLGLKTSDVNGNASHTVFTATGGMSIIDTNPAGEILSLGFRGFINPGGVTTPEPATVLSALAGAFVVLAHRRLRRRPLA